MSTPRPPGTYRPYDDEEVRELFEDGTPDHVCDLIRGACGPVPAGYRAALAANMKRLLSRPIGRYFACLDQSEGELECDWSVILAFRDAVKKIASRLKSAEGKILDPEDAADLANWLRRVWREFIDRSPGYRVYSVLLEEWLADAEHRTTQRRNASAPRKKKCTTEQVQDFRDKFFRDTGSEYGWAKAAAKHFNVDESTIHRKLAH